MSNYFCHQCGKKQPAVAANFCCFCGANLKSMAPAPAQAPPPKPSQFEAFSVEREGDDDSYIDRLQHLNIRQTSLHLDIVQDKPLGETFASAIMNGSTSPPENFSRPALDRETCLKEFQNESKTLRNA